jgi:hypothetical protein
LVWSRLSTPIAKNISIPCRPKSPPYPLPSRPTAGAYRDRHGRGAGCGGRGLRQACDGSRGGLLSVSDLEHAKTTAQPRTVKSCGPDASMLASSLAEVRSAQPGRTKPFNPRGDGGKNADRRGDHEVNRKTIACGNAGRFRCDCCEYSCAYFTTMRTRGCGCTGHPAFPAPSLEGRAAPSLEGRPAPFGRKFLQHLGRTARRDGEACLHRHSGAMPPGPREARPDDRLRIELRCAIAHRRISRFPDAQWRI